MENDLIDYADSNKKYSDGWSCDRKQKTLALRLVKPFMISLPDVIERPVQTV